MQTSLGRARRGTYIHGIVSLIASEHFAKNPPPRRIGKPSNMGQKLDIWISGYLNIWISGYLDIWILVKTLCCCIPTLRFCVVQPCRFSCFPEKSMSLVFCNLKQCVLHSTRSIFNRTRLDRCELKNECVKFQYRTKLMTRKFEI